MNLFSLARQQTAQGNFAQAAKTYTAILKHNKNNAEALLGMGAVKLKLDDKRGASRHLTKAIRANPQLCDARFLLANILAGEKSYSEAIKQIRHCVRLEPKNTQYLRFLADLWELVHEYREVADCYKTMVDVNPEYPVFHNNLGLIYKKLGLIDEATAALRRAMELEQTNWAIRSNFLLSLNFSSTLSRQRIFEEHQEIGRGFPAARTNQPAQRETPAPERERRLRIGFLSPDFRKHSVAFFFEPVLAGLDREAFEIFCYAQVGHPDETTARMQSISDNWYSTVGVSDWEVAAKIRCDQIDILIDLAGHTVGNRLPVFATRAAPVQATWLGYPNTTGIPAMDFRITDSVCDPIGEADGLATEELIRLPNGFLCYRADPTAPDVVAPSSASKTTITFGSFNNPSKINEDIVALWAGIMQRVPGSKFMFKYIGLEKAAVNEQISGWFEKYNVARDRLIFMGFAKSKAEHFGLYGAIDIALDTHPYNGTTTTCDSLWMGVPVITLQGDRHASRVGASLLHQIGLPELVAHDEEEFITIAHDLAQDLDRLNELRFSLREKMRASKLMDEKKFSHQMGEAFFQMLQLKSGSSRLTV